MFPQQISNMNIRMKSFNVFLLLLLPLTNCIGDFGEQNEIASESGEADNKYIDGLNFPLNVLDNEEDVSLDIFLIKTEPKINILSF